MVAPPAVGDSVAPSSAGARLRIWPISVPALLAGLAFLVLFITPFIGLAAQWWSDPDSGHGLLLFPVALWLAWRSGIAPDARPNVRAGLALLVVAVLLRAIGSAAAELFTQR